MILSKCFIVFGKNSAKKTTINLNYNFKIELDRKEDFGSFTTYNTLFLFHSGIKIFSDTAHEYDFSDKIYPILNKINNENFEILLDINNRPNKDYLMRLNIKNNKIVKKDKFPTFIGNATYLTKSNILEYAGFWDYNEVWGKHAELTGYNPILYYKLTKNGIRLDSDLTIKKNTFIYGKFNGFYMTYKSPVSAKTAKKFQKEVSRIELLIGRDK